jgi:hypothetical protein
VADTITPRTTLVGVFEDRSAAERAVAELEQSNFKSDQVGFAIRGSDTEQRGMISDAQGTKDARGAVAGAATGAGLGAILGAAAAMLLPGFGPVVAGGILAMAFGGAVAGTAVGGIFGAMTGLGVSEEEAKYLEHEFNSGRAIVAVKAGPRAVEAAEIMRRHGGYDIQNRRIPPVQTQGVFSQT